jgi:hypothetical protein
MGWNCPACGTLLKPDVYVYIAEKGSERARPRTYDCPQCKAKYLVVEGMQPRIYFTSVIICIDDGENK